MDKAGGLEYEITGEGEPVLLIHGGHLAATFEPLTREPVLTERYRVIRYHRRGFAGSDRHSGPFSIADQARDAVTLLDEAATFFEVENDALEGWKFDAAGAKRITQPVLYIAGSESGPGVEALWNIFSSWVSQAEKSVLQGLNHSMLYQAPPLVAQAIAEFVACHPMT